MKNKTVSIEALRFVFMIVIAVWQDKSFYSWLYCG
mgnify:CR=1 FL=1